MHDAASIARTDDGVRTLHRCARRLGTEGGGARAAAGYAWLTDSQRIALDGVPEGAVALLGAVASVEGLIGLCGAEGARRWEMCVDIAGCGADTTDERLPLAGRGPHSAMALLSTRDWLNGLVSEARVAPIGGLARCLRDGPALSGEAVRQALEWLARCADGSDWKGLLAPLGPNGSWLNGVWTGECMPQSAVELRGRHDSGFKRAQTSTFAAREALLQVCHDVLIAAALQPDGDRNGLADRLLDALAPDEAGRIAVTFCHTLTLLSRGHDGAPRVISAAADGAFLARRKAATLVRLMKGVAGNRDWRERGPLLEGNATTAAVLSSFKEGLAAMQLFLDQARVVVTQWTPAEWQVQKGAVQAALDGLGGWCRGKVRPDNPVSGQYRLLAEAADLLVAGAVAHEQASGFETAHGVTRNRRRG